MTALAFTVRRLGPGDERTLEVIAREEPDFDIAGRGEAEAPLSHADAAAYLADPGVLHWIAERDGELVGTLQCQLVRKSGGAPREVLLYDVGVRSSARRIGVGRALLEAMTAWMREHDAREVWVLADNPEAIEFYRACGFAVSEDAATYMTRVLT